jgi:hypothetical protein
LENTSAALTETFSPAYLKSVRGLEEAHKVLASADRKVPTDWSPDGRLLVFQQESAHKQFGLYALPLGPEPKPRVLVDSEFDEIQASYHLMAAGLRTPRTRPASMRST